MKKILTIALFLGIFSATQAQEMKALEVVLKKGIASFYHDKFNGRKTATGETFQNSKFTAASNQLRLNTYIKVTNLSNNKVVYVRVNDRMASNNPRLVDLSETAAQSLDYTSKGLTKVKLEVVSDEEGKRAILAQREAIDCKKNNTL